MEGDEGFELVPPVGRGGQPEPAPGRCPLDAGRERHRGQVVTLVHDDQAVVVEHGSVVTASQALDHGDVDDPGGLVAAAADLTDLRRVERVIVEGEMVDEARPPLVDQLLAVDDHQGRHPMVGDDGTPGHTPLPLNKNARADRAAAGSVAYSQTLASSSRGRALRSQLRSDRVSCAATTRGSTTSPQRNARSSA